MLRFRPTVNEAAVRAVKAAANTRLAGVREQLGPMIVEAINTVLDESLKDDGSGWVDIYRDLLTWVERKGRWSIRAEEEIELSRLPLDRTMFWFNTQRGPGNFLAKFNPWPSDLIPVVLGGYTGRVLARAVSGGEIEAARTRIAPELADIRTRIAQEGVVVSADGSGLPAGVLIDMEWLAKRIEHGLGGFPRQPHLAMLAEGVRKVLKR